MIMKILQSGSQATSSISVDASTNITFSKNEESVNFMALNKLPTCGISPVLNPPLIHLDSLFSPSCFKSIKNKLGQD
jgi:hypothetical protein